MQAGAVAAGNFPDGAAEQVAVGGSVQQVVVGAVGVGAVPEEVGVAAVEDLGVLAEAQAAVAAPAEVGRRFKGEDRWA